MNISITGSTGFIGSALIKALIGECHRICHVIRPPHIPNKNEILWNPVEGYINRQRFKSIDVVIHLAGENISPPWTAKKKQRIRESRVKGTKLLAETLAGLENPPKTLICASAIGFYGDRPDETLMEESPPGRSYLANVCIEWEKAAQPAIDTGIRTVFMRFGMVLSPAGGALAKMLPVFKLCIGGPLGNGKQYTSWITLDDVVSAIIFVLNDESLFGPVNVTAPVPVTNTEFTKSLAHSLHRPAVLPVPEFALNLLLGTFAREVLLSSTKALPEKLIKAGFSFQHPNIVAAFQEILV